LVYERHGTEETHDSALPQPWNLISIVI